MSNVLSRERVGELLPRAALAIMLAGTVKALIHIRGTHSTAPETGGWTPLTLFHAVDHHELFQHKRGPLEGREIEIITPGSNHL